MFLTPSRACCWRCLYTSDAVAVVVAAVLTDAVDVVVVVVAAAVGGVVGGAGTVACAAAVHFALPDFAAMQLSLQLSLAENSVIRSLLSILPLSYRSHC